MADRWPEHGDPGTRGDTVDVGGRSVSYAEYGDPRGDPILFFHGTPGSRLLGGLFDDDAALAGLRLIAPERPGIGRSDPLPDGALSDWPADVRAILDSLDVDTAGVVGFSGGGPFALACGCDATLADRITGIGLLAGAAPPTAPQDRVGLAGRLLSATVRLSPRLARLLFRVQLWAVDRGSPRRVTSAYTDREVDPDVADLVYRDFLAAFEQGPAGVVRESVLLATAWDLDLDRVARPVTCWYGRADTNAPVAYGEYLVDRLPTAECRVLDDADHLDVLLDAGPDALRAVGR